MQEPRNNRTRRPGALLLSAVLATSLTPGLAQTAPQTTFSETVDVDLVNVEVWVTDSNGRPVPGLSKEAFSVVHDGAPVAISHFSEMREGVPQQLAEPTTPVEQAPQASELASERHLVVLFDLFRLTPASQKRLVRDLRAFMSSGKFPAEHTLLLRLENALAVAAPFGSTADEVDEAFEMLEKSESSAVDLAADHRQVLGSLQDLWTDLNRPSSSASIRSIVGQVTGPTASQGSAGTSGTEPGAPGSAGAFSGLACEDFVDRAEPILVRWSEKERTDTMATLDRLTDTASFLSGLDGPKTLVYVSDGLGLAPGVAATDFVRGVCPGYQTDLEIDTLSAEISESFYHLARQMSSNRITVYALQSSDLGGDLGGGAGQNSADRRGTRSFRRSLGTNARRGLTLLAEQTGGRAIFGSKDHHEAMRTIAEEMGSHYSLAYPPPAAGAGPDHEVSVRLSDPSLEVRHRRSYSDKTPEQWLAERLESALYLGMVSNPLSVRLGAGNIAPGDENLFSLPLHVMVPVDRLAFAERSGRPMAQLQIRVMALNAGSRTLVIKNRPMLLPRPGAASGEMFDLKLDLELEGGRQMVAVGVRDQTSGEASFVSTTIQVGSADSDS